MLMFSCWKICIRTAVASAGVIISGNKKTTIISVSVCYVREIKYELLLTSACVMLENPNINCSNFCRCHHVGEHKYKLPELLQVSSFWRIWESIKFYDMIHPFLCCREGAKESSRKFHNSLPHNLCLLPNIHIFRLV